VIEFSNGVSGKQGFEQIKNCSWCETIQGMNAGRPDSGVHMASPRQGPRELAGGTKQFNKDLSSEFSHVTTV
jgi:hypothetical protein